MLMTTKEQYFDLPQVARLLGLHVETLRSATCRDAIDYIKAGHAKIFTLEQIEKARRYFVQTGRHN